MNYTEIKSHSSLLSNERIAILFYMLDTSSINLNTYYNDAYLLKTKSILYQIYKNIRAILRGNSQVRSVLNIDTKEPGVYTLDIAFDVVEQMIQYCTFNGYTYKKCYIISQHLNQIEIIIRDILQFFAYFFRPEYKQKPDVLVATEKYKEMADKLTLDQLKKVVGKNNKIDFDHLGERALDSEESDLLEYKKNEEGRLESDKNEENTNDSDESE